jgi:alpha-1,2-mannosyltransferase
VHWLTILSRRRSWDVVFGMGLTVAAGFGLIALAVGPGPALAGLRDQVAWVSGHEKPWHLVERGTDLRPNNESLPIVLARTFGDVPSGRLDPSVVSLTRLPLDWIWGAWWAIAACLVVGWLASIGPAGRAAPERGWLGMFALTSIVMLAATPICWNHYFLWTLPAALFLLHRPRLVVAAAVLSLLGSLSHAARGAGCHMLLALGLFALVVHDLRREAACSPERT